MKTLMVALRVTDLDRSLSFYAAIGYAELGRGTATTSCAPAAWPAFRPGSPSPATPADCVSRCCAASNPSTNSAIVRPGTSASGDGSVSYAARRRNLACRPPALGPLNGEHESLPHDGD
jgi:catechol 2,3-dioxygenase-like lactoylglutathione lyase family enzyme